MVRTNPAKPPDALLPIAGCIGERSVEVSRAIPGAGDPVKGRPLPGGSADTGVPGWFDSIRRSFTDAEKRPAQRAVTEAPVDVPSLALRVNELRRWMGPRQASCRGSARHLHPLPFTYDRIRQAPGHLSRWVWSLAPGSWPMRLATEVHTMSKETGGPAFPVTLPSGESYQEHLPHDGMTLRDYFAAKALQGMLPYPGNEMWGSFAEMTPKQAAESAYGYADAMLAARVKP